MKDPAAKYHMERNFGFAISILFSDNQFFDADVEAIARDIIGLLGLAEGSNEAKKITSSPKFCMALYDQNGEKVLMSYLSSIRFVSSELRNDQLGFSSSFGAGSITTHDILR